MHYNIITYNFIYMYWLNNKVFSKLSILLENLKGFFLYFLSFTKIIKEDLLHDESGFVTLDTIKEWTLKSSVMKNKH